MSNLVTADITTLVDQAHKTASDYMIEAVRAIDNQFGIGYSKNHPNLVAAFMKTTAADFNTAVMAKVIDELGDAIKDAMRASTILNP